MRQNSVPVKEPADQVVRDIRRATRQHFSAADKIRIALEGLRGKDSRQRGTPHHRCHDLVAQMYRGVWRSGCDLHHFAGLDPRGTL